MDEHLKYLSLRQPLAWAVCVGEKTVENRSRSGNHRGLVIIHAGKHKENVKGLVDEHGKQVVPPSLFAFGAFIGAVDLADVVPMVQAHESDIWACGPYCWKFCNPRLFAKPIACKGQVGLPNVPKELYAQVREQLARPVQPRIPDGFIEAIRPDPAELYYLRALSYGELGKLEDCIRNCTEAISLVPDANYVYQLRGRARFNQEKHSKAFEDLGKAIEIDPEDWEGYYWRACCYQQRGDMAKARRDYHEARERNPDLSTVEEWEQEGLSDNEEDENEPQAGQKARPEHRDETEQQRARRGEKRRHQESLRLQGEGERKLARLIREGLQHGRGTLPWRYQGAVAELCRRYLISQERAEAILQGLQERTPRE
jgi:tetratricopeptide (TPR) repeat protein